MKLCIVCGIQVKTLHCQDHRDAAHPQVKKTIHTDELFREVPDA